MEKSKKTIRRITYELLKERFEEHGFHLLEKDDGNINTSRKMSCCDNDGYLYETTGNRLNNNRKPLRFSRFNKYTEFNINHYLCQATNGKSKLLEHIDYKDYNNNIRITFSCCECGEPTNKIYMRLLNLNTRNFYCKKCNNNRNPIRYSFDFIKKEFAEYGYKIISEKYEGNNKPLVCYDKDGYLVEKSYVNLKCKKPIRFSPKSYPQYFLHNINNYFRLNKIKCKALDFYFDENKYDDDTYTVLCECECGNLFETNFASIKTGQIRCRECSKIMSILEYKVEKYLKQNNIKYEFQKRYNDCKDKKALPFDFYLPQYNILIEVDGEQHYSLKPYEHLLKNDDYEKRFYIINKIITLRYHDRIKNQYCINNNIKLIRIRENEIRSEKRMKEILNKQIFN